MKKYFLSIVALAGMLFATSCQESLVEPQMEGPTTFTVQLPDQMGTKAIGDASSVNTLYVAVYNEASSSTATAISKVNKPIVDGEATIELNLIQGVAYDIVFWAQYNESYVNSTSELITIDVDKEFTNSEDGAVFYAYKENFVPNGKSNTVTLTRPFAQLNLGTTLESLITAVDNDVEVVSTSLKIKEVATKFVTVSGLGEYKAERTLTTSGLVNEDLIVNGTTYKRLSMDYLTLVDGNKTVVDVVATIIVNEGGIQRTIVRELKSVPVMKNARTNIVGNFISSESTFTVEVDDTWNESEEEVYDVEWGKLLSAAKNGGTLTLSADVVVPETIIIEKNLTLNLNGKTIKNELGTKASAVGTDVIIVNEGATLTIEGDGTIEAVSGNDGYAIIADGTVIINGGKIKSGIDQNNEPNAVVYARNKGKVYVNGGIFPNEHNSKFVLNKKDAHRATTTIEVRGGKFYNFNPQNNAAEGDNTNFVAEAEGYRVYEKDGWYEVYLDTNIVNLYNAASNGGEVTLTDDVTLTSPLIIKKSVKLNLGDKTITGGKDYVQGLTGIDIAAITVDGGNLIIEGEGSIIGSEYGVYAKNGGTLTVKGGELKGKTSAIQIAEAQVNIEGGKFSNTDDSDRRYVINCLDANWKDNTAKVNITGGSFYMFDPSNNVAEGANTNFCAEGYGVYENVDQNGEKWYDVMYTGGPTKIDAVVTSEDQLNAAMVNGATIVLNGKFNTIVTKLNDYSNQGATGPFLQNVTIVGTSNTTVGCINLCGADNLTIRNITFDAAGAKYGYDGAGTQKVYAFSNIITGDNVNKPNKGAHNLVIDGCTFTGTFAKPGVPIAFTDQKRGSGGSGNITIKYCTFDNKNANYAIYSHYTGDSLNGHGDFVIENNTFKTQCYGYPIALGKYASSVPVVVNSNKFETVSKIQDAIIVQDHSTYGATYTADGNTFGK